MKALLVLWLLALVGPTAAMPPRVTKVEPPHWWAGHSVRTVRLLVRGENLTGGRVIAPPNSALTVGNVKVSARGTYLFADVTIARKARPGPRTLRLITAEGQTNLPFSLAKPLEKTGRFRGITPDDVVYLVVPDRFSDGDAANNDPVKSPGLYDPRTLRRYHGGDFAGVRKRLLYLKALGVTALWMTPVYDNADAADPKRVYDGLPAVDYHGYGATDMYGVEEHFGTAAELRALVDEAHRLGIKVVQDQVCNHVGPAHPWAGDPPTPTWLNGTPDKHVACDFQVWNLMNPWAAHETQEKTLRGWFADVLPDLNQDDPETARYLIQNSLWWVGTFGFNTIRQDTLPYAPRRFWREWTTALKREYPYLNILGEVNMTEPEVVAFFQGGVTRVDGIDTGVQTLFDYGLYGATRRVFSGGRSASELAQTLARDWLYPNPGLLVTFLSLHDVPCFPGLPGVTAADFRIALTFLCTVRGIPMLYYGDEIGLKGADDPYNRRPFPGGFTGAPRNAFTDAGRTPEENETFAHVQRLLRLRAETPFLRRGRLVTLAVTDKQFAYVRTLGKDQVALILLNLSDMPASLKVSVASLGLKKGIILKDALGSGQMAVSAGSVKLALPPRSSGVFLPSK